MLLNYAAQQPRGYEGQVDGPISHEDTFPRTNPAKAQKGTITIAGRRQARHLPQDLRE